MNQIDFNNAVGKTIAEVFRISESQCVVVFDDQTFSKIEGSGDEDWDGLDTFSSFSFMFRHDLWPILLEIGLITQEFIDARLAAQKMDEERDQRSRRAQYENLKMEFGNEQE